MSIVNKKTKIICTIGPASSDKETLIALVEAGMNAARMNFSHGDHEEQKGKFDTVKEIRTELGVPVAIVLDTKGPEIRTEKFKNGKAELIKDSEFVISFDGSEGDATGCSATYPDLVNDVKIGDKILIDDGLIGLTVTAVRDGKIITNIDNGGEVKNNKSINLPGTHINLPSLTEKDKNDIAFGIKQDIDFVAASFTRSGEDVARLRAFLDGNGGREVRIISKVENIEGVENIDEIISLSDGVMVARGDLGVEIAPELVPNVQKEIIAKCNKAGKFVVTATQMLDSMMRNPRPTRAEVGDVANAIYDGTDCVMLSGETANGDYPLEAVTMMSKICQVTESDIDYDKHVQRRRSELENSTTNAIGLSACRCAESLNARAIIAPTTSGHTAAIMSSFRPSAPVLGFATSDSVVRKLVLNWGVKPFYCQYMDNTEAFFSQVIDIAVQHGELEEGDNVILTVGLPLGVGGKTNTVRIHTVGKGI
ncbi:MAG: pyruvate kinase [Clostridiales Family XIII bacterium]|jgi:pyruvate kinase|nr:pyruvate kinase [Clostridiales Family XIII bacterium]